MSIQCSDLYLCQKHRDTSGLKRLPQLVTSPLPWGCPVGVSFHAPGRSWSDGEELNPAPQQLLGLEHELANFLPTMLLIFWWKQWPRPLSFEAKFLCLQVIFIPPRTTWVSPCSFSCFSEVICNSFFFFLGLRDQDWPKVTQIPSCLR